MEWKETLPERNDWQRQWDLTAYYGEHIVGSIVLNNREEYCSVIDGCEEDIDATNMKEAREEFYDSLELFLEGEINYYNELRDMLKEIRQMEASDYEK